MLALVIVHLLVAVALPALSVRHPRPAFAIAALPPSAALVWTLAQSGRVLAGNAVVDDVAWAPSIALHITFRLDALALLMTILVSGIGALVLVYSRDYFGPRSAGGKVSAPLLLAFAGVMLGLVLADDLITVYVFWELTTICSFLLVGQTGVSRESRRSALQALMITTLGGLVMLIGFVVLGQAAGSYRISELAANPPGGGAVGVAAVLILVGAFTKSAQLPFHNWLPAAMVAPTPISAYLHAASMVTAGVFLVARLAPVFAGVQHWSVLTAVFGLATMLVGGWRALHEHDLKRLLAYGTVSQLGFLMVLVGDATYTAAVAGATILLAHGLFKATLFLVVGIIDHQTGTRDIRDLSGLGRRLPVVAIIAAAAAASMAGLPPLLDFLGKEAAFAAFSSDGFGNLTVLVGLVVGSALTVGYTLRLLWGAFAVKPGGVLTEAEKPTWGVVLPAAVPAAFGVVLGVAYPVPDAISAGYAHVLRSVDSAPGQYHLALWHGLGVPLLCSVLAVGGGLGLHAARTQLRHVRASLPKPPDAQLVYDRIMGLLERVAVAVTGRTQVGSLPTYLGIVLLTVLVVPGSVLMFHATPVDELRTWDRLLRIPLAAAIVIAALGVVRARRRLTAVLLVGVIGYGIGGMFVVGGGPDLGLTQFLVETLTLVAFVFVLRQLPARFTQTDPVRGFRVVKAVVAVTGGVFMAFAALVFSSAREEPSPVAQSYIARAEQGTGATNVVNAIIVDFRALDTVGEISVLAVTATGVASLVLSTRPTRRRPRRAGERSHELASAGSGRGDPGTGPGTTDPGQEEVRE